MFLKLAWMKFIVRKNTKGVAQVSHVLYDLPAPPNLSKMWNFGSLLGLCLVIQLITGVLLTMHYTASAEEAFNSVVHIMRDVNEGWLLRACHANGASMFFIMVYLHMGRGVYYLSFFGRGAWLMGVIMLCVLMAIAFTGYVLPWGQMSFWGATVITNLLTAIPYVGESLVQWVWGGICVGDPTLKRFFTFHFSFPFLLAGLTVGHIILIHESGTSNPLGVDSKGDMIPFHSYYSVKDLVGVAIALTLFGLCVCLNPDFFLDPVNFCPADTMKTPLHIQPEWYFLFAYSILRSIPSKTGGIAALAGSIVVLFFLPIYPKSVFKNVQHNPLSQVIFFFFVGNFMLLTFLGTCPVEEPFISVGMGASFFYFFFFLVYPFSWFIYEYFLFKSKTPDGLYGPKGAGKGVLSRNSKRSKVSKGKKADERSLVSIYKSAGKRSKASKYNKVGYTSYYYYCYYVYFLLFSNLDVYNKLVKLISMLSKLFKSNSVMVKLLKFALWVLFWRLLLGGG